METFHEFEEIVITLFEGHYHIGVAALLNSLHYSNFRGLLIVGYKDQIPTWVSKLDKVDIYFKLDNIFIYFSKISSPLHFGYYKPLALKRVFDDYPTANKIYYFDPDIVVSAPWNFFSDWVNNGICLCLDNCFPFVHRNHPWRDEWIKLSDTSLINDIDYYVNSGFIGIKRSDVTLLTRWIEITTKYQNRGGNTTKFEKEGFRAFKGDQDLLNAVITVSPDLIFSIIGTEGMGFSQPAYLMSHAIGEIKPWKKSFISLVIKKGMPPNLSDKNYLKFANKPVNVFNTSYYALKKIDLKLASMLARLISAN